MYLFDFLERYGGNALGDVESLVGSQSSKHDLLKAKPRLLPSG